MIGVFVLLLREGPATEEPTAEAVPVRGRATDDADMTSIESWGAPLFRDLVLRGALELESRYSSLRLIFPFFSLLAFEASYR